MKAKVKRDTALKNATHEKTIIKVPKGAAVSVTSQQEGWCAVEYGGQTGYIQTLHLDFEEYEPASNYIKVDKELLEKVYKTVGRMLGK